MRDLRLFPERLTRSTQHRLRDAMSRGKHVLDRPRADAMNVVEFGRLDLLPLNAQRNRWPRYEQLVEQGSRKVPQFGDLLVDLFFGLYFAEPSLRPRSKMARTHCLNYDLFMQTQALPMWEEARTTAVYQPNHAIIGLVCVAQALLDAIDDGQQQHQQQSRQRQEHQDDLREQLRQALDDLAAAMPPPPDGGQPDQGDDDRQPGGSGSPMPGERQSGSGAGMAAMFASLFSGDPEPDTPDAAPEAAAADQPEPELDPDPDPGQESLAGDIERRIDDLLEQIAATGEQDDAPPIDEARVRRAAKQGVRDAMNNLDELNDWLSAWGSDPGEFNALNPDVAFGLYERMRTIPNVRQFALELGRMRASGRDAHMQKNAREPREIVDIATGRSWSDALPTERMLLAMPELEDIFWLRWAQEGLLTWQYGGTDKASRGPFIMLIDVSGSTMGGPERWGKAFALTALDMARREERDCGVIFFSSIVRPDGVFTFPGGKASLADKIAIASYYTGGGTNWQPPLAQALTNIEATEGTWNDADIVLITDGECSVSDEFAADYRRRCLARGIRTHGVLLDDGGCGDATTLEQVCDRAIAVSSLAGSDAARPIFDLLA